MRKVTYTIQIFLLRAGDSRPRGNPLSAETAILVGAYTRVRGDMFFVRRVARPGARRVRVLRGSRGRQLKTGRSERLFSRGWGLYAVFGF